MRKKQGAGGAVESRGKEKTKEAEGGEETGENIQ